MLRALLVIVVATFITSACTQRMVCPAFQSAYIYDKDALRKKFSYFKEDSTPKVLTASKTKFLIAESTPYRKKVRTLQTVSMRPVYVTLPDSLRVGDKDLMDEDGVVPGAELDLAARSVIDSIYIVDVPKGDEMASVDSVYVISKDKEVRLLKYETPDSLKYDPNTGRYVPKSPKYTIVDVTFNVEQDNYMWYLREYLVLPDVRLARMHQDEKESEKAAKKSKKGLKGFFRNLFKKKEKTPESDEDELHPKTSDEEEFDFVDEEEQERMRQKAEPKEEPQQKKGLFSRTKKDKQPKQPKERPSQQDDEDDAPPVEDKTPPIKLPEDEGF